MIEIRIKSENKKIQSSVEITGKTKLYDVAMMLLELERMKQKVMEESENYESDMEIITNGEEDESS